MWPPKYKWNSPNPVNDPVTNSKASMPLATPVCLCGTWLPNTIMKLWSEQEDYVEFKISHDPSKLTLVSRQSSWHRSYSNQSCARKRNNHNAATTLHSYKCTRLVNHKRYKGTPGTNRANADQAENAMVVDMCRSASLSMEKWVVSPQQWLQNNPMPPTSDRRETKNGRMVLGVFLAVRPVFCQSYAFRNGWMLIFDTLAFHWQGYQKQRCHDATISKRRR